MVFGLCGDSGDKKKPNPSNIPAQTHQKPHLMGVGLERVIKGGPTPTPSLPMTENPPGMAYL